MPVVDVRLLRRRETDESSCVPMVDPGGTLYLLPDSTLSEEAVVEARDVRAATEEEGEGREEASAK